MATPTSVTSSSSAALGPSNPDLFVGLDLEDASVVQLATGRGSCPTPRPPTSTAAREVAGQVGSESPQSDGDLQRAVSAVVRGTPQEEEQVATRRSSRTKTAPAGGCTQRLHWADPHACANLTAIILGDRQSKEERLDRRRNAAAALCSHLIAPFLRFDAPLQNMLYVFGGRNQKSAALNIVEMLDTWHGRWVRCPPLPCPRVSSTACVLPDGRLMVIGGYDDRGMVEGLLSSCEVFDPRSNSWKSEGGPSLKRARWGHSCASMNGKIFVVGGCSLAPHSEPSVSAMETLRSCEVYDPEADVWSDIAPLCVARSGARVVNAGGHLVVVGGCDDIFGREEHLMSVEIYDPEANRWSLLSQRLQKPRPIAGVAALPSGEVLIVGGAAALSSVELYEVKAPAARAQVGGQSEDEEERSSSSGRRGGTSNLNSDNSDSSSSSSDNYRGDGESTRRTTGSDADSSSSSEDEERGDREEMQEQEQQQRSAQQQGPQDEEPPSQAQSAPTQQQEAPRVPPRMPDAPEGRMGCQATPILLPGDSQSYPLNNRPSVAIVGGEIWGSTAAMANGRPAKRRDFSRILVWDVETSSWRTNSVVPPMPTARTAVAVCVGEGFVRH